MMNPFLPHPGSTSNIPQSVQQKTSKFHDMLRQKHIEAIKSKIRKEYQCQTNLSQLLETMPKQLEDVLNWCRNVLSQYKGSQEFKFTLQQIMELFHMVSKFPCLETVELLYSVSLRLSIVAIHELFQFDITGLLHNLIIKPEKIVPALLIQRYGEEEKREIFLEIVKKCMMIIATLSEQSQKARNYMVMSHKTFLCLSKARQTLGDSIDREFITCLYAFTKAPFVYHQQFLRIIKTICMKFCDKFDRLNFREMILLIKAITSVIKCREKWTMDMIEQNSQYDVLEKVLKLLHQCNETAHLQIAKAQHKNKQTLCQLGQITHQLNLLLIHYIEISINQYFEWQAFLSQWFSLLTLEHTAFQYTRRDVYFIFNNIICQADEPASGYHLLRRMIFEHRCVHVFAHCLESEVNEDVMQELSYCVHSLMLYKSVAVLEGDIFQSGFVGRCLETVTRDVYPCNAITKETLLLALLELVVKTEQKQARSRYIQEIKFYEDKIQSICMLHNTENHLLQIVDRLYQEVASHE